jgi:hypothetical protein
MLVHDLLFPFVVLPTDRGSLGEYNALSHMRWNLSPEFHVSRFCERSRFCGVLWVGGSVHNNGGFAGRRIASTEPDFDECMLPVKAMRPGSAAIFSRFIPIVDRLGESGLVRTDPTAHRYSALIKRLN